MFTSVRTTTRLISLKPLRPNLISHAIRYNSTNPKFPKSNASSDSNSSNSNTESKTSSDSNSNGFPKGKVLVALGLLVGATSVGSIFYNNEKPQSSIEPKAVTAPAFNDGEISVLFVLGGPGAGKGTQCAKLVEEKGFVHLSAGDLLRAEQARPGSKYGELIATYIREGKIVPQEVTIELLKLAITDEHSKGATKFLIDGFPRKMDQALTFEDQIAKSAFTLFFECPELVMLQRLLERGKTSGRTDDNVESIKKRFQTFIDTSMPVVEHFDKQGKVVKVRCDHPVDDVYARVLEALAAMGI